MELEKHVEKNVLDMRNFFFNDVYFKAWGHVFYEEKLTQKQIDDYELVYGGVHE